MCPWHLRMLAQYLITEQTSALYHDEFLNSGGNESLRATSHRRSSVPV